MSTTLEFKLLGKDYRIACEPDEREALLASVAMLETKLGDFGKVARGGGERVAVMAALDLAHELTVLRSRPASESAALESESIQRRINSIEARVADALEQHETLF
jgi:cell division protein ZapA